MAFTAFIRGYFPWDTCTFCEMHVHSECHDYSDEVISSRVVDYEQNVSFTRAVDGMLTFIDQIHGVVELPS